MNFLCMLVMANHVGAALLVAAIAIGLTVRVLPLLMTGKHIFRHR